ncbi:MAG: metallophosphoesterase [Lachnospiraceae bacterium]|nr:metallophosphoesterase [Lachnospiraceae bacterium]
MTLITGDLHRRFERIISFSRKYGTVDGDTMIILGDAGINFYGGRKDKQFKDHVVDLGMKFFCIHGNHEMRPESTGLYKEKEWNGGIVYVEDDYPDLMFAKDGEIFDIDGYKTIVIGGAYSVDKFYRLERGYQWFADEQPTEETKAYVEQQLDKVGWNVDVVLSHTVPYQYRPVDLFIRGLDQSTVDSSTEKWLTDIESRLTYKKWYAGHYHCDRDVDNLKIMYRKVCLFMSDTDLKFEME